VNAAEADCECGAGARATRQIVRIPKKTWRLRMEVGWYLIGPQHCRLDRSDISKYTD